MSYQSVQLLDTTGAYIQDYRGLTAAGRTLARAQLAGPQTQAIAALADFLNLATLAWRVTREVDALGLDAVRASWASGARYPVSRVGALVHVLCFSPRNGLPLTYGAAILAGCGLNPSVVIHDYLGEQNLQPGTPPGTDRVSKYIWRI
jgi:hypothetical protein